MSFDLNLQTVCNHKVYKERVVLGDDQRSLRVSEPIASSNLDVYASEDLVPKSYYALVEDPESTQVYQSRMILFKKKWRSVEDYFDVTYPTIKNYCPKCIGLDVIDDISLNIRGDFYTLRNENLLMQNMEKFTVTEIRSNTFQPFIGTSLVKLIGQKMADKGYLTSRITVEVTNTLQTLKSLQNQYKAAGRAVTDGELLDSVSLVKVNFDTIDPSILRVDVTARAVSGKSVDYTQLLKVA